MVNKDLQISIESQLVNLGVGRDENTGAISFPVYPSATYRHPALGESTGYEYIRSANPTRQVLEDGLALLEGGSRGLAFSSGMAALTTLLLHFSSGDHFVVSEDLYGGTFRIFDRVFKDFGVSASFVDTTDIARIEEAICEKTAAILIESPGNPLLGIADIRSVARLCREREVLLIVDNTLMTPLLQKPLELGADIVVHSATKYLGGHNDLCAGVIVVREPELGEKFHFLQNAAGAVLSPDESWLLIRSLKTLSIRLERQCENAMKVALYLKDHEEVETVYYPGLPEHRGHELQKSQAEGFGGMISFRLSSPESARRIIERVKLISFAESLGGVESLITLPAIQTHSDIPEPERLRLGITDTLLRLSVGIEKAADIIEDLEQAFSPGD